MASRPVVVDRVATARGELVLRRVGEHFEVISNGTLLMDTRDGRSERLLVDAALRRHPRPERVLVGGLGVGFSLERALADDRVQHVTVVELEQAVVDWHATQLRPISDGALDDARVMLDVADVHAHLGDHLATYDVVCLDVDNGPDWTVTASNTRLYDDAGTRLVVGALRLGGVVSVWSAQPVPAYERVLHRHLDDVSALEVPVERGPPDVVYVGCRPPSLVP